MDITLQQNMPLFIDSNFSYTQLRPDQIVLNMPKKSIDRKYFNYNESFFFFNFLSMSSIY